MKSKAAGNVFNFFRNASKNAFSDAFRVTAAASLFFAGEYAYNRFTSNKNKSSDIPAKNNENDSGKEPKL